MIGNNSVQIILGDQEETVMSRKNSGDTTSRGRKYGRVSADYHEVAISGLKRPANDNGGAMTSKTKNLLKVAVPLILGLGFLAWF